MIDLGLVEAWQQWLGGKQLVADHLWGVSILWLGRVGKLTQFVGASMIIADIIGPARIRRFGDNLMALVTLGGVRRSVYNVFDWYRRFYVSRTPDDMREVRITWSEVKREPLLFLATGLSFLEIVVAWSLSPFTSWWINVILSIPLLFILQLAVSPIVAALVSVAFFLAVVLFDLVVVRQSQKITERICPRRHG